MQPPHHTASGDPGIRSNELKGGWVGENEDLVGDRGGSSANAVFAAIELHQYPFCKISENPHFHFCGIMRSTCFYWLQLNNVHYHGT